MRGKRSELAPGRKSPRCHVNTPLSSVNGYAHALRHTILPVLARQSSTRRQIVVTGNISMSQLFFSRMNCLLENVCNSMFGFAVIYIVIDGYFVCDSP